MVNSFFEKNVIQTLWTFGLKPVFSGQNVSRAVQHPGVMRSVSLAHLIQNYIKLVNLRKAGSCDFKSLKSR